MGLANSAALRAAGISRATRDIAGGVIVRDPRTGEPTGILKDDGDGPVRAGHARAHRRRSATRRSRRALAFAASKGVTAFAHVSVVPADLGTYLRAKRRGHAHRPRRALLPARDLARGGRHRRQARAAGDDWVWIGGVKGYVDGSLGSTHGAVLRAVRRRPQRPRACCVTPEDSLRALDRRRRLGRPPGRGPRHRRAGQRPDARHLRQRGAGARPARPPLPDRARPAPAAAGHRPHRANRA